ncbi:MAG: radical SAM protein [Candidatus Hatepunaea meridiana]|nr:radical SAM protein [Candidatus Hatepunaea meridiana]
MFKHLQNQWTSLRNPRLDWIQVEISSYCNASCIYCPHTIYRDSWQNRYMPLSTFERLQPVFSKTRLVFLQGWGEPFMNRNFFEMATMVKESGCTVGTSTNGMLLDDEMLDHLVVSQIDIIAFSLAGATEANDRIRVGTTLDQVLTTIRKLDRLKKKNGSNLPRVHIAYLLLRSGLNEIYNLPELLKGTGVSEGIISTLDFVPSTQLVGETIAPKTMNEFNELCVQLDTIVRSAADNNVRIHYRIRSPENYLSQCTERSQNALFVSSNGDISPCVFTCLPVENALYYSGKIEYNYQPLTFGNINKQSLSTIWHSKEYHDFRKAVNSDFPPVPCRDCPKRYMCSECAL